MMRVVLPRVYVILDAALLNIPEKDCARNLADAGVRLIQYRNKNASACELFEKSLELAAFFNPIGVKFIVNDRADVASLAGADGVHVGTGVGPVVTVTHVTLVPATQVPVGTGVQMPFVQDSSRDVPYTICAVERNRGVAYSTAMVVVTSMRPIVPLSDVPATGSQYHRLPSGPVASGPVWKVPSEGALVTG